jgi:Domain of unknown function (DUF5666)
MSYLRAHLRTYLMLFTAGTLLACGAGTQSGVGVGGTGTGSQAVAVAPTPITVIGPITGFGSVILNGTRFDDTAALVIRDAKAIATNALRLGMTIELTGTKSADGLTGTADSIRVFSEIQGPVQTISAAGKSLVILGSTVAIDINTVFSGVASLAEVRVGDIVEAYGLRNLATGDVSATRIEVEKAPPPVVGAPTLTPVALAGIIQSVNAASSSLVINGQTVNYSGATITGVLSNGLSAKLQGIASSASSQLTATSIVVTMPTAPNENRQVEIEGIVTNFVSRSDFKVNSNAVNASSPTLMASQVARLANGARCQVTGIVMNAVIQASKLECESSGSSTIFEVSGSITALTSLSNFVVRNQIIDGSAAKFFNGTASQLKVGKEVGVKGSVVGGVLKASTIEIN